MPVPVLASVAPRPPATPSSRCRSDLSLLGLAEPQPDRRLVVGADRDLDRPLCPMMHSPNSVREPPNSAKVLIGAIAE